MIGVPLDSISAARLPNGSNLDAGHKWMIFDRSSAIKGRSFSARKEWIEAELLYDMAGIQSSDQEAILAALENDVRDLGTAVQVELQQQT